MVLHKYRGVKALQEGFSSSGGIRQFKFGLKKPGIRYNTRELLHCRSRPPLDLISWTAPVMGSPSPAAMSPEPMCVRCTKFMGSPIMERSIRLLLFLGWGFSTTQQPSLCQKSLMLVVVAASVPPGWHSCRDPWAGSLHGDTWLDGTAWRGAAGCEWEGRVMLPELPKLMLKQVLIKEQKQRVLSRPLGHTETTQGDTCHCKGVPGTLIITQRPPELSPWPRLGLVPRSRAGHS